jgi:hypothetical protein
MTHRRSLPAYAFVAACFALLAATARAHEYKLDAVMNAFVKIEADEAHLVIRAPLYLFKSAKFPVKNAEIDLANSAPAIERALAGLQHDVVVFEDGQPLKASKASARLSLPSDKSFETYEQAVRHVAEPMAPDTAIYIDQGYVDAHLRFPIGSPKSVFSVRTTAAPELRSYLKLALRYLPLGEETRAMVLTSVSGTVNLNPPWYRAATGFAKLGIAHILTGTDHLLFLLCLIIPLRGWRQILAIITTFTVAHSFTLLGSAFGLAPAGAWFPPFVETAIAASIVYMALENIIGVDVGRRVLITGLFGLVHGFGFSYGLQENLQFAGTHLLVSLFAFNLGIEIGQILFVVFMLPALAAIRRYLLPGRVGTIILSAVVAHIGWHWMADRWEVLSKVSWPQPSATGLLTLALWVTGILLAAGAVSVIAKRLRLAAGNNLASRLRGVAD